MVIAQTKIYKKAVELCMNLDKRVIEEGTIKIKHIPHECRYVSGLNEKKLNLGQVFTTKHLSKMDYLNTNILIKAEPYQSKIQFKTPQFYNSVLTDSSSVNHSIRIEKLRYLLFKKDIISNLILACFSEKNFIQVFENNKIIVLNVDKNTLLYEALIRPEIFLLLNSNSKFVVDAVAIISSQISLHEFAELKFAMQDIANLSANDYSRLMSVGKEGLTSHLIKDVFKEHIFI